MAACFFPCIYANKKSIRLNENRERTDLYHPVLFSSATLLISEGLNSTGEEVGPDDSTSYGHAQFLACHCTMVSHLACLL